MADAVRASPTAREQPLSLSAPARDRLLGVRLLAGSLATCDSRRRRRFSRSVRGSREREDVGRFARVRPRAWMGASRSNVGSPFTSELPTDFLRRERRRQEERGTPPPPPPLFLRRRLFPHSSLRQTPEKNQAEGRRERADFKWNEGSSRPLCATKSMSLKVLY